MATLLSAAVAVTRLATSLNHTLSGVFGSVSLAAWICLLVSWPPASAKFVC